MGAPEGSGLRVGLTGATGHLGSRLLPRLVADPAVSSVVSVARRPLAGLSTSPGPSPGRGAAVEHVCADLRSAEARRALTGVDVLVHLGFALWGRGVEVTAVNVEGTANVLAGRPRAVVLASSAAVYGAWPDSPVPIPETWPAHPNPECPYAAHKLEVERRCAEVAPTVVARVVAVLGPHADPAVARAVSGYRLTVPAVRGVAQATQFLDEDDAADALHACVGVAVTAAGADPGAGAGALVVNVAPADWLDAAAIAAVGGGRVLGLPRTVLLGGSEVGRRLGLLPFGADRSVLLCGPLALDASRAAEVLGWRARRTSAQVLAAQLGRKRDRAVG